MESYGETKRGFGIPMRACHGPSEFLQVAVPAVCSFRGVRFPDYVIEGLNGYHASGSA